jgi:hypothetical protein
LRCGIQLGVDESGMVDVGAYDAAAHAHWRLRHDGTSATCEASATGASESWVVLGTVTPAPAFLRNVLLSVAVTPAGTVRVDELAGGGPPLPWCGLGAVVDGFDDPDTGAFAFETGTAPCERRELDGVLTLGAPAGGSDCRLTAVEAFDPRLGALTVRLESFSVAGAPATSFEPGSGLYASIDVDEDNSLELGIYDDKAFCYVRVSGVSAEQGEPLATFGAGPQTWTAHVVDDELRCRFTTDDADVELAVPLPVDAPAGPYTVSLYAWRSPGGSGSAFAGRFSGVNAD